MTSTETADKSVNKMPFNSLNLTLEKTHRPAENRGEEQNKNKSCFHYFTVRWQDWREIQKTHRLKSHSKTALYNKIKQ